MEATMKKTLALCGAWLVLGAPAALAGLDLTWNACNVDGGVPDIVADCATGGPYELVGCFEAPAEMSGFVGMDIYIDLQAEAPGLSPFWHFEDGGCNAGGLVVSGDRSAVTGGCTAPTPWDAGTSVSMTAYGAGLGGANRARLLCSVTRLSGTPLEAGQNYYGFHLRVLTTHASEAGGACAGCPDKMAMVWNQCDLFNQGGVGPPVASVTAPGSHGSCAGWNGPSTTTCATTPVRNRTWGQIKVLYR
jgi:hypothetical protein